MERLNKDLTLTAENLPDNKYDKLDTYTLKYIKEIVHSSIEVLKILKRKGQYNNGVLDGYESVIKVINDIIKEKSL